MKTEQHGITRRSFLQATALSTGTLSFGGLTPLGVLGANDRIRVGVIGVGGMGSGHLNSLVKRKEADNIEVPAVCDVYRKRVNRAKAVCNGEGYMDYRKLLERKDIDAVLIATPDHWHSKITIDALEAGKHVYCEKPMTHTVEQAIQTRDAVRMHKKVVQIGPNGTGNDSFWKAHQAIKEGRIGKATWAHASYNRNQRNCAFNFPIDPNAGPDKDGDDYIDWDMWLGHKWGLAPKIPWNPNHFFQFRKYFPYNGGVATDLLYHKLAPLLIAMAGPDGEYPLRVNGNGGLYIEKDGRDIPDVFMMTVDYPSEWSIFLVSVLTNSDGLRDKIYGKHGTMELGGEPYLKFNGEFKEEFKAKNDGKDEIRIPVGPRRDLEGNWLDVIRGNGQLACNAELGAATMVAIKMAVESYRRKKTLLWDAKNEKVVAS